MICNHPSVALCPNCNVPVYAPYPDGRCPDCTSHKTGIDFGSPGGHVDDDDLTIDAFAGEGELS